MLSIFCKNAIVERNEAMNSNWFKGVMKAMKIVYGDKLMLTGTPVIYNQKGANIVIGRNVTIKSSFLSNLVGLYSRTIIVTRTRGAEIVIGDNVGISGATIYARKSIHIGDRTCIGGNCKILDNDFHPIDAKKRNELSLGKVSTTEENAAWIGTKPIFIGKDCFIGCNTLILKGSVLEDGCVVGAGAVVSGKFEAWSLIAGNPAQVIRKLR